MRHPTHEFFCGAKRKWRGNPRNSKDWISRWPWSDLGKAAPKDIQCNKWISSSSSTAFPFWKNYSLNSEFPRQGRRGWVARTRNEVRKAKCCLQFLPSFREALLLILFMWQKSHLIHDFIYVFSSFKSSMTSFKTSFLTEQTKASWDIEPVSPKMKAPGRRTNSRTPAMITSPTVRFSCLAAKPVY